VELLGGGGDKDREKIIVENGFSGDGPRAREVIEGSLRVGEKKRNRQIRRFFSVLGLEERKERKGYQVLDHSKEGKGRLVEAVKDL